MILPFPRPTRTLAQLEAELQRLALAPRRSDRDSRIEELAAEIEERRWRKAA